jgi:hypothetical protein
MNRKVALFKDCPKQAEVLLHHLAVAEAYLPKDPDLIPRLRVSRSFLVSLFCLQRSIIDCADWACLNNSHDLYSRLRYILSGVRKAVESGRVHDDSTDVGSTFSVLVDELEYDVNVIISMLSNHYLKVDDPLKALALAEEQYCLRSERFGPDDIDLQRTTLQICKILSVLHDYERMMDYLDVAMERVNYRADHGKGVVSTVCYQLFLETDAFFVCAASLPLDHPRRLATFAKAFQLASECFKAQIEYMTTAASCERRTCRTTSFIQGICKNDEIVVEFETDELLALLRQLYDIYSSRESYEALFHTVKDIVAILYTIFRKLQSGAISSTSLNWAVILPLLHRCIAFENANTHLDGNQLAEQLKAVERERDSDEISRLRSLLHKAQVKDYICRFKMPTTELFSYHPDFVGSKTVGPDGTVRLQGSLRIRGKDLSH